MALVFQDAEKARDAIVASQKKEIAKLYSDWAAEIGERAKYYANKTNASAPVSERQMKELQKMLQATGNQVSKELYGIIEDNLYMVSDAVVKSNVDWLSSFGFSQDGLNAAFSNVPDQVVRRLITGQIYDSGWSLSDRIWGNNQDTLKDIYQMVAKGVAENRPIYAIAKELQAYVEPNVAKPWNPILAMKNTKTGKIEKKRIYRGNVDYNAQRLARTLVQHGYQQSFIATTQNNPFITDYVWHSNGSRPCELCQSRDGKHFKKDELPMDHPNGMCVMEPVVADDMVEQIADWFNNPDGTYPEIDSFAKNFGYEGGAAVKANMAGMSWYKAKDHVGSNWYNAQKYMESKGTSASAYWKDYISGKVNDLELDSILGFTGAPGKKATVQKVAKATKSASKATAKTASKTATKAVDATKAFNEVQSKYLEPLGFTPDNMPTDFNDFSHKMTHEMGSEILHQMGTNWLDPHPYQKIMQYYNQNLAPASLAKGAASKVTKAAAKVADKVDDAAKVAAAKKSAAQTAATSGNGIPDHTTWIDRFKKKQTTAYMYDKEEAQMKLIGDVGQQGIKVTGQAYTEINAYLRAKAAGVTEAQAILDSGISKRQIKAARDAIDGLKRAALDEDLILRRGTDLGDLAGAFMSGDFGSNMRSLYGKTPEELNDMFQGAVGTYGGLTSTSGIWEKGFSGDVEIVFFAPEGTEASSIMSISQYGIMEGETLLNAETHVRCVKIEASDGHKGSKIRAFLEILVNK